MSEAHEVEAFGVAGWRSRRRANVEGGRERRHIVRVSAEEEAQLMALAERHRVTVARLLVESALAQAGETPSERRNQFVQLARLGGVANNIIQIARRANATGCGCAPAPIPVRNHDFAPTGTMTGFGKHRNKASPEKRSGVRFP